MEKCIVLSDGDKLRGIRKKYGLKQEEITGKEITRNLISEIETNKASITKKTAEIVIKNLIVLAKNRGFKVTETVEYLMENQIVQATKVLDDYIEELKTLSISKDDSFIKTLKEAESFLIDWDIKDKKLKVYELAGDYYCNNNEMYQGAVYYEKASALVSRMFLDRELLPLSRKLSMVYGYIGDYKKSIECCEFALRQFEDMSLKDKVAFRYNNALSYKHTGNFEKSMENIKIAEDLVNKLDISTYIKILNNKASCLYEMKRKKEALMIFNEILNLMDIKNLEQYLITLINIISIYVEIDMKDEAIKKLDIVTNQLLNLSDDGEYLGEIYCELGNAYKKLDKLSVAEKYYLKALDFCEKQQNYVLANDILCGLIEMYVVEKKVKNMDKMKEKAFFIANRQGKINNEIMYKLIIFFNKISSDVVKEIANFALNFK